MTTLSLASYLLPKDGKVRRVFMLLVAFILGASVVGIAGDTAMKVREIPAHVVANGVALKTLADSMAEYQKRNAVVLNQLLILHEQWLCITIAKERTGRFDPNCLFPLTPVRP